MALKQQIQEQLKVALKAGHRGEDESKDHRLYVHHVHVIWNKKGPQAPLVFFGGNRTRRHRR